MGVVLDHLGIDLALGDLDTRLRREDAHELALHHSIECLGGKRGVGRVKRLALSLEDRLNLLGQGGLGNSSVADDRGCTWRR